MSSTAGASEESRKALQGLAGLVDRTTSWLVEVGTWVLGGLVALNLVVIAALITVGPVDRAVLVAVVAFACALPLDVAGIVLLRLIKDIEDVRLEQFTLAAFREARFPNIEAYFPPTRERKRYGQRRARIGLAYALAITGLSVALTVVGIVASLWHMAPWVAEAFAAAVVVSAVVLMAVVAHSLPPESPAEMELKRKALKESQ